MDIIKLERCGVSFYACPDSAWSVAYPPRPGTA